MPATHACHAGSQGWGRAGIAPAPTCPAGSFHELPAVSCACLPCPPPPQVFGTDYPTRDGTCLRDYIHVIDLVRWLMG